MPRVRRVPLCYGPKRVVFQDGKPDQIVQSVFCGECDKLTRSVTIQVGKARADREKISRVEKIGVACDNFERHKNKKKYLWPDKDWILPRR